MVGGPGPAETVQQEKHQWTGHHLTSVAAYACFGQAHLFKSNVKSGSCIYVGGMQEELPWSECYEQLDFLKKLSIMFNTSYTVAENVDIGRDRARARQPQSSSLSSRMR